MFPPGWYSDPGEVVNVAEPPRWWPLRLPLAIVLLAICTGCGWFGFITLDGGAVSAPELAVDSIQLMSAGAFFGLHVLAGLTFKETRLRWRSLPTEARIASVVVMVVSAALLITVGTIFVRGIMAIGNLDIAP